jgi:hypothetical protein
MGNLGTFSGCVDEFGKIEAVCDQLAKPIDER